MVCTGRRHSHRVRRNGTFAEAPSKRPRDAARFTESRYIRPNPTFVASPVDENDDDLVRYIFLGRRARNGNSRRLKRRHADSRDRIDASDLLWPDGRSISSVSNAPTSIAQMPEYVEPVMVMIVKLSDISLEDEWLSCTRVDYDDDKLLPECTREYNLEEEDDPSGDMQYLQ